MSQESRPGTAPVPRLWAAFVLGWLLVLAVVAWRLPGTGLTARRVFAAYVGLFFLAALFLWLTLRASITSSDLSAGGPLPAHLRQRSLVIGIMALLVLTLAVVAPGFRIWWLMMHPVIAAGLSLPTGLASGAIGVLLALALGAAGLVDRRIDAMILLLIAFGAAAAAIRRLTTTVAQLREAREELARSAVSEERLRFARDLHDLLGRSLTMIVLKSELAGRLARQGSSQAALELADVERTAREALQQVRAAVTGYRHPSLASELAAARELLAAAGVVADIDTRAAPIPCAVDGLMGWAVREGVTNVIRHSGARACTVRITRWGDDVRAEITDDGNGGGERTADGTGLAGLAERAAAFGGRIEAGPLPAGGFRFVMTAPLNGSGGNR